MNTHSKPITVDSLKEHKEKIKANIKWHKNIPQLKGGQHCGVQFYPLTLKSEELDIEITIGHYKSQFKNKELAFALFELALDDILR